MELVTPGARSAVADVYIYIYIYIYIWQTCVIHHNPTTSSQKALNPKRQRTHTSTTRTGDILLHNASYEEILADDEGRSAKKMCIDNVQIQLGSRDRKIKESYLSPSLRKRFPNWMHIDEGAA